MLFKVPGLRRVAKIVMPSLVLRLSLQSFQIKEA